MELELEPLCLPCDKKRPIVIAGPCSAETEEQVMSTARMLADKGCHIFRAGVWKPRTKPGGFEGNGEKALPWLKEVKEETGLTIMPDKIIHQATTFFKRNAEAQANQSIQLYFTHSQLYGQINNDNITDSEKTYTSGMPEWVDLDKIDDINFRHSVDLKTILQAYISQSRTR